MLWPERRALTGLIKIHSWQLLFHGEKLICVTYLFGLEGFFCVIGFFFSLKNVSHITVQEVEFMYF